MKGVYFLKIHVATSSAIFVAERKLALSAYLTSASIDWMTMPPSSGSQNIANIFGE